MVIIYPMINRYKNHIKKNIKWIGITGEEVYTTGKCQLNLRYYINAIK